MAWAWLLDAPIDEAPAAWAELAAEEVGVVETPLAPVVALVTGAAVLPRVVLVAPEAAAWMACWPM